MLKDEEIFLTLHFIFQEASHFKAIVGNSFLKSDDIRIINGIIIVYKKEKEIFLMGINVVETEGKGQVMLDNIEDSKYREEVKHIMENYSPKSKSCEIKMKLVVFKNEERVYEYPS